MHILNQQKQPNNIYDATIIESKDLLVLQQLADMLAIHCACSSGRCVYIS